MVGGTTEQLFTSAQIEGLALSGDGNVIAFSSTDPSLVGNDDNGAADVFVYIRRL